MSNSLYEISDRIKNDSAIIDILMLIDALISDCGEIDKHTWKIMLKEENAKVGGLSNDEVASIGFYKADINAAAKKILTRLEYFIDINELEISVDVRKSMYSMSK